MRPTVIVLCAAVLAVSGLTARKATRSASPATTPTTQSAALDGCVQPGSANLVDVGGGSQAAVLGTGPVGVVLSNQSDQNLCAWLPFARTLAARGFRVLVYDYGITGNPAGDVAEATATLRQLGTRTVLLVGASQGAKASLVAAAAIRPAVGGVVSLSAEQTLRGQDVRPFAAKLGVAVLFMAARGDPYGAADATPRLYRAAARASSRRLLLLPGDLHGTGLLTGPDGAKVRTTILDFLSEHGHAP
jgi:pimeloyl-ACP methyl ester carboxylesterase